MSDPRSVIVTGGTFGIGRDISLGLAELGHRVVAFGVDARQASSTAEGSVSAMRAEVAERGADVAVLEADVSDAQAVDRVVAETLERHGRIDALVNNAAIGPLGTVLDTDEELFERIMAINLKGPYLASRAVLPHLISVGGGSIVNIGSGAGWGKPGMAAYGASKGGLHALSTAMAYDFFHDRVRINTVIPGGGGIASGITLGRRVGDPPAGESEPAVGRAAAGIDASRGAVDSAAGGATVPAVGSVAGRPVVGADVANAVAFLIGDEAEAISGTCIDVGCFAHQGGPVERKTNG